MPLGLGAAAILGAGLGAAGSVGSNFIQSGGSRRSQKRANRYNLEFWRMQNEYNHPAAQMARLEDAGLNPNLIYGTSPTSATGNAGAISPAKAEPYKFDNPLLGMQLFADVRQKDAQTDNLKTQNEVLDADVLLKAIEAGIKGNTYAKTKAEAGAAEDLVKSSVDAAREQVRSLQLKNANQADQNFIMSETKMYQIDRIRSEAKNAAANLKGQQLLNKLRDLEQELKSMGIERTDNMIFRFIGRRWNDLQPELKKRYQQFRGSTRYKN